MSSEALKRNLPRLGLDEVQAFVRELYGIEGEFLSQVSERDLSWRRRRRNGSRQDRQCRRARGHRRFPGASARAHRRQQPTPLVVLF